MCLTKWPFDFIGTGQFVINIIFIFAGRMHRVAQQGLHFTHTVCPTVGNY
jgi:hypothetical protein